MKKFNCLVLSFSLLFTDIDKPFNPCIGQTFQGLIGDYQITAQQISHHPPVSAFYMQTEDFKLYGNLQLHAVVNLNDAVGVFYGDIIVQFNDKQKIQGSIPTGKLNGILFGKKYFAPEGSYYSFDRANKMIGSFSVARGDNIRGNIGKLTQKQAYNFFSLIDSNLKDSKKLRYQEFIGFSEKQFHQIYTSMDASWSQQVSFDGEMLIHYEEPDFRAPKIVIKQNENQKETNFVKHLLPSDSNFRKDINLRRDNEIEESQKEKQRIEEEERDFRKLREKFK